MRLALLALLTAGCSWTPVVHVYPSGLTIARVDQDTLDKICSHMSDEGKPIRHAVGCYGKASDTIYILNSPTGAQALTHEWAHREGIEKPSAQGYDW